MSPPFVGENLQECLTQDEHMTRKLDVGAILSIGEFLYWAWTSQSHPHRGE